MGRKRGRAAVPNIWLTETTSDEQDWLIRRYADQPLELDHLVHTQIEDDMTIDFIAMAPRFRNPIFREELRRVHETLIALRKKGVLPRKSDGKALVDS